MIGIVDHEDKRTYWEELVPEDVEFIFSGDIPFECSTVIISEEFAGAALEDMIIRTHEMGAAAAVAALSPDGARQDGIFGLGADDIIILPVGKITLAKHLAELCADDEYCRDELSMDSIMRITENGKGTYDVPAEAFESIYRFVLRVLSRVGGGAQVIVVTLRRTEDAAGEEERVMEILSRAVHNCLRRGDMTAVCGPDKVIALLIGADDEGGHLAANRLVNSFYSECTDSRFELSYDIQSVKTENNN